MVKAAEVRAQMEEIDRLFREMNKAYRKIERAENELWELEI
jgi:hypothetical protein